MATSLIKQGTSIASTSKEETEKLSSLAEQAGVVPSTPAGAAAIGATPQQAAMARTPASKPTRVEGVETMQDAQRLTPKTPEAATAPEKLDRMRSLGSLNTQVEGLVEGYMQQLQSSQAALSLNAATLGVVEQSKRPALETALNKYKSALTEVDKEAAVIEAGNALGRPLTQAEMAGYFAGAPEALSTLAKTVTPESVSLRDLNLASSGVNLSQVASDLGVSEDELAGLSLPQLNQKIAALKAQEFSSADAAEVDALSAVGNRAKQLQTERQALGQTGVAGYERQFDDIQSQIEGANSIKIGGQETTIDKMLQDETLSSIITGAAISDGELRKLETTEPALAAWVKQYRAGITQLAADAGLVAKDVAAVQAQAADAKKNVSDTLFSSIFGPRSEIMSEAELNALKGEMQGSALWSLLNTDSAFRARLEAHPEAAGALKNLSTDELTTTMNAVKKAEALPVLGDLMGWTPGGILTPSQVDFVNTWSDELEALPAAISSDKTFQNLIKSGELNEAGAALLAQDPTLWENFRTEQAARKTLSAVDDEQEFLTMLTGDEGFGLDDFNDAMISLKAWASTGDQKALGYYTSLTKALTGPDGVLDLNDVKKAVQEMSASGANIGDVLGGKQGLSGLLKKLTGTLQSGRTYNDASSKVKQVALAYLKNDHKIDSQEMAAIYSKYGEAFSKELLAEPWVQNKEELRNTYNSQLQREADRGLAPLYEQIKRLGAVSGFSATPDGIHFNIDLPSLGENAQDIPAYRAQISSAIAALEQYSGRSASDPKYSAVANSLKQKLDMLDKVEGASLIVKELYPGAPPALIRNILRDGSLANLAIATNALDSGIWEPGLSPQQILAKFKASSYNKKMTANNLNKIMDPSFNEKLLNMNFQI